MDLLKNLDNMITAKDFWDNNTFNDHEEALKASNLVKGNHISTLDCYPLENIK